MSGNAYYDGAGAEFWNHTGVVATPTTTYPSAASKLGGSTATYTASKVYGARVIVVYSVLVVTGAAADTVTIGLADAAGTFAGLTGLVLAAATTGTRYAFPGGIRVESTSANLGIQTQDAAIVSVVYRKLA